MLKIIRVLQYFWITRARRNKITFVFCSNLAEQQLRASVLQVGAKTALALNHYVAMRSSKE
jgi:hypothetical protein